ncbi:hypothetical protein MTO96_015975 [Rhipicephalus appendiculatus]
MATSFKPVTHVIFDLDGVVLDADKVYAAAVEDVVGRYHKKYTWELKKRVMGMPDADAARIVIDTLGLPVSEDYYLYELDRLYKLTLSLSRVKPGAEDLIRHLHAHGVPIAMTTSTMPLSFGLKMAHHRNVLSLFNHVLILGRDPEVKHGKPNPDIFLVAASKFYDHPPPVKVLVFEDTPAGVTAALDAGMQVVMVPDPRMDQANRSRATLCIDSLVDFKPELFGLPSFPEVHKRSPSRSEGVTGTKATATASMFKPVSHVLFDLDGLLLEFTWDLKKRVLGSTAADAARTVVEALGLPLTPDEYMAAVDRIFRKTVPDAQLMPGEHEWTNCGVTVGTCRKAGSPPARAWRPHGHCDQLEAGHLRPEDVAPPRTAAFLPSRSLRGGNPEVKHGKPHPDIFLVAASKFDEKPPSEKVLVFEDAVKGVMAALAAGMQVVMVPDPRIDEEHRRQATTCITSLLEFKPELFGLPAFDTPAQDPKQLQSPSNRPSTVHRSMSGARLPTKV